MLSVMHPTDFTRAERMAAQAAHASGPWRAWVWLAVGALFVLLGVFSGASAEVLLWRGLFAVLIAWIEWEHFGFSSLLERRDAEIRRLKDRTPEAL